MRIAAHRFDDDLPRETEVVVIGAGLVGVCAAWYLAQRGIPVVVCEKGYVGAEQSTRALGWVRVTSRDPRDVALNLDSRRRWASLTQQLGNTGYRTTGLVYTASDDAELEGYQRWLAAVREVAPDSRLISAGEARALLPACPAEFAKVRCIHPATGAPNPPRRRSALPGAPGNWAPGS